MPESFTNTRIRRLFNLHKVMRDMKARSAASLAAELAGTEPPTNERLIKEDIAFLRQLGADIPLGNKHSGFQYKKPFSFVSAADGLDFANAEDILSYLEQVYSRFPRLEALGIDKLFFTVFRKLRPKEKNLLPAVQFHEVDYSGFFLIGDFFRFIRKQKPILVRYQPFGLEEREVLFIPQLLREYNHRWFVIGTSQTREKPEIFALDRVIEIKPAFSADFTRKPIPNIQKLYKDVLGVSLEGEFPMEIILRISRPRADYIRTKKWHKSQKELEVSETDILFCWYLHPNRELKTKILEYLPYAEVIKPEILRDWLRDTLKDCLSRLEGSPGASVQEDLVLY